MRLRTTLNTAIAAVVACAAAPRANAAPATDPPAPVRAAPTTAPAPVSANRPAAATGPATAPDPAAPDPAAPAPAPIAAVYPALPRRFADAGTRELGVTASGMATSHRRDLAASAAFGWFPADRFELATTASIARVADRGRTAMRYTSLVEPIYHLALDSETFGFIAMGAGLAYASELGAAFLVAPRIGVRFVVGTRGVATAALAYEYVSHTTSDESPPVAPAAASALRAQVGYSITW